MVDRKNGDGIASYIPMCRAGIRLRGIEPGRYENSSCIFWRREGYKIGVGARADAFMAALELVAAFLAANVRLRV